MIFKMICINCNKPTRKIQKNNFTFIDINNNKAKVCDNCYEEINNKLIAIDFSKLISIKKKHMKSLK